MAGLLRNRTRATVLEIQMHAALHGQYHGCPKCGKQVRGRAVGQADYAPPRCTRPDCDGVCYPLWTVRDARGRIRGSVGGTSHREALDAVEQTPAYDRIKCVGVDPAIEHV